VIRYNFDWRGAGAFEHPSGSWVKYDEASDLLQDERDKLARIEKVAQVAMDNWPESTLFSALKTVLQICQDGKASPVYQQGADNDLED
jgi:hypothetical protein